MVDERSDCHLQIVENDLLYCTIGPRGRKRIGTTTCVGCLIGKLWRDIGCDKIYGKIDFEELPGHRLGTNVTLAYPSELYCKKLKNTIDFGSCEKCEIRDEFEIELVIREALSYLEVRGFNNVVSCMKDARALLFKTDRKHEDNEVVITHVAAGLEETLIRLIPKYGLDFPRLKTLGELWRTYKTVKPEELYFNEILHSIIPILTTIRNKESRSHISERTPTDAETYFYYSLSTIIAYFLVRSAFEESKFD